MNMNAFHLLIDPGWDDVDHRLIECPSLDDLACALADNEYGSTEEGGYRIFRRGYAVKLSVSLAPSLVADQLARDYPALRYISVLLIRRRIAVLIANDLGLASYADCLLAEKQEVIDFLSRQQS